MPTWAGKSSCRGTRVASIWSSSVDATSHGDMALERFSGDCGRTSPRSRLSTSKAPTHSLRASELARLVAYGWQYLEIHDRALAGPDDLTLALVTPCRNEGFDRALTKYKWAFTPLGNGYGRIDGVSFTVITAFTNEVSEAEADEFLRIFQPSSSP